MDPSLSSIDLFVYSCVLAPHFIIILSQLVLLSGCACPEESCVLWAGPYTDLRHPYKIEEQACPFPDSKKLLGF